MPRILVFDDQGVYRAGLCELISANDPCAEVIEARNLNEASSQIRKGLFDLVLVGMGRSNLKFDSLKFAREASPATRFAIISASNTRTDILNSLAAGFHGFISKCQPDTEILAAMSDILAGRIYVPGSLAETEAGDSRHIRGEESPASSIEAAILKLTRRQREVLVLLARGRSNKEIARALNIAEATTKIHMAALLRTLGVRNRTEAAYKAAIAVLPELNSPELGPGFDGLAAVALRSAA